VNACPPIDGRSARLRLSGIAGLMGCMESNKPAETSEQTRWMLAVRDVGDRAAFARLFDFYAPRLKAMAARTGTPASVAEDIAQDVMLRVWQSRAQFDPSRAQASAWIYQIARNRRIDLARRAPRPLPEEIAVRSGPNEAAEALALDQEVARLRDALRALPAGQREMVERAYLGELTHQEISRQTSLPLGTVKSRLRLAIGRLRHELRGLRT
jgi:RNA polymerase sigma-70 factor, ECF subfamily